MAKSELSRGTVIAAITVFVLLLGGLVWWRASQTKTNVAYSNAISKLETSPDFIRQQEAEMERRRKNPNPEEANRMPRDKEYQPESGER